MEDQAQRPFVTHEHHVRVPERGQLLIDRRIWQILEKNHHFWTLCDRKIVKSSQRSRDQVQLEGSCWVGRAVIDTVLLEVVEKIDGALLSLLDFATKESYRIVRAPTAVSSFGSHVALIVQQFLACVQLYVNRGVEGAYSTQREAGSLVGGRLHMSQTISLRTRGFKHQAVFERSLLSLDTPKNRVVLAALLEIEQVAQLITIDAHDLTRARAFAPLFAESRTIDLMFGARAQCIKTIEYLLDDETQRDQELLLLAHIILARHSFEPDSLLPGSVPRSWFVSLEVLFERAVRQVLATTAMPHITLLPKRVTVPIFAGDTRGYTANPDLVLEQGDTVIAVGDIKYKQWTGKPEQHDLYQLLTHARAFRATQCFLVYPHESFECRYFSEAATGCHTWVIGVNVQDLDHHLRQALIGMELRSSDTSQE